MNTGVTHLLLKASKPLSLFRHHYILPQVTENLAQRKGHIIEVEEGKAEVSKESHRDIETLFLIKKQSRQLALCGLLGKTVFTICFN